MSSTTFKKVIGFPHLRKDDFGMIYNFDKEALKRAQNQKERSEDMKLLMARIEELEKRIQTQEVNII